jgi:hypothetical protein
MQATARRLSVVSETSCPRRRLIRDVRLTSQRPVSEATPCTTDFVASWVTAHRGSIGGAQLRLIRQDQYGPTLCWEFETVSHYIQFLAWDHDYCVDLHALHKDSGADHFLVAGSCEDIVGVSSRLDSFLSWMQTHPTYSTALP